MNAYTDPLDSADNPQVPAAVYYGQVAMDVWYCVLQKGTGKVPFDPGQHKVEERRTAIKITVLPIADQQISRDIFREYIAEFGAWPKITLPSIKALNMTARSLNNAWAKAMFVPDGRTYTDKNGETKESTTLKFLAVYPTEAACRTAYLTDNGSSEEPAPAAPPAAAAPTNGNGNGNGNGHSNGNGNGNGNGTDKARETAWKFAEAIVRQENGDRARVSEKLAKMTLVNQYFTFDSPEVQALIMEIEFNSLNK